MQFNKLENSQGDVNSDDIQNSNEITHYKNK